MDQGPINDLIKLLSDYKKDGARIKALEIMLDQIEGPSDKLIASYGEQEIKGKGPVIDPPELAEYKEKVFTHKLLDVALEALTDINRDIIKLRHVEKKIDRYIIEEYIPDNYKDGEGRPLYITRKTLNRRNNKSLFLMVKILQIDLNYKIPTIFSENVPKMSHICPDNAIKQ